MRNSTNSGLVGAFTIGGALLFVGFLFFTGRLAPTRIDNERFVLVFNENVFGLNEGGKVTFNGVKIGRVERFFIGDALEQGPVPVLIEIDRQLIQRHRVAVGNEVFEDDGKFKPQVVPRLIGQLVQESLVTGILYVNLSAETNASDNSFVTKELYGYPLLRSKNSIFAELSESINFERLSKQISRFLDTATLQINNLKTEELRVAFLELSANLNKFLEDFTANYLPLSENAIKTLDQIRNSFAKIDDLNLRLQESLAPDSDLRFGATNALRDLSDMSKSLKSLADLLERNPQALLRGKSHSLDQ